MGEGKKMDKLIKQLILEKRTLGDVSADELIRLYDSTEVSSLLFSAIQQEVLRRISKSEE